MSSVWKHPRSPYWTGIYRDESGKWRRFPTKERLKSRALLAAQKLEELARFAHERRVSETAFAAEADEMRRRLFGDHDLRTAREFFESWIQSKQAASADSTGASYGHTIEEFLAFLKTKADGPLRAIDATHCQAYYDSLLARKYARATLELRLTVLRSVFTAARRLRLVEFNPAEAVRLPKKKRLFNRRSFTPAQISLIIRQAAEEKLPDWETATLFGYYFGPRIGDAAAMRWERIDLVKGTARYRAKKTSEEQTVALHPVLHQHLIDIAGDNTGAICPTLAGRRVSGSGGLSRQFIDLMRRAGIGKASEATGGYRTLASLSFHSLRKTFISEMHKGGVSEELRRKIVGHRSAAVHDIYTETQLDQIRDAVNQVPHLVLPNKRQLSLGFE